MTTVRHLRLAVISVGVLLASSMAGLQAISFGFETSGPSSIASAYDTGSFRWTVGPPILTARENTSEMTYFSIKTLSQNASGTECNPGAGEVEKRKIVLSFLFPTN